jgi:hypothetical protein
MHARAHTHTHTHIHTHTYSHTLTHSHTHTLTLTHAIHCFVITVRYALRKGPSGSVRIFCAKCIEKKHRALPTRGSDRKRSTPHCDGCGQKGADLRAKIKKLVTSETRETDDTPLENGAGAAVDNGSGKKTNVAGRRTYVAAEDETPIT